MKNSRKILVFMIMLLLLSSCFIFGEKGSILSQPVEAKTTNTVATKLLITKKPNKTVYAVGEKFNSRGMKLQLKYKNGTRTNLKVSKCSITGFSSLKVGTVKVTVQYQNLKANLKVRIEKALSVSDVQSVKNSSTGIYLKWSSVSSAKGYYVYRKAYGESWKRIAKKGKQTFTHTDKTAVSGVTYNYCVKAFNGKITAKSGKKSRAIKRLSVPVVELSNLTDQIKISWASVAGADSYDLYKKVSESGSWKKYYTLNGVDNTEYSDTDIGAGKVYYYSVRAISGGYKSAYSSKSNHIARLSAPTLTGLSRVDRDITLSWEKVDNADGYCIYRYNGTSWKKITTVSGSNTLKYTDKNNIYWYESVYRITAYSGTSQSSYSNKKRVTSMKRSIVTQNPCYTAGEKITVKGGSTPKIVKNMI